MATYPREMRRLRSGRMWWDLGRVDVGLILFSDLVSGLGFRFTLGLGLDLETVGFECVTGSRAFSQADSSTHRR